MKKTTKTRLKAIGQYLIERAKDASTWRGLILIATGFGVHVSPDRLEMIVMLGLFIAGAIGAAFPDRRRRPNTAPDQKGLE